MNAKEYLKQARYLDVNIDTKLEQVTSLHELATKATSTISDMPGNTTRNTHRMEDIIIKILMAENEINEDIDRLVNLKNEIHETINRIEDEEYRIVLTKRYLNFESWESIAADMHCSIQNIYRIHSNALRKVKPPKTDENTAK